MLKGALFLLCLICTGVRGLATTLGYRIQYINTASTWPFESAHAQFVTFWWENSLLPLAHLFLRSFARSFLSLFTRSALLKILVTKVFVQISECYCTKRRKPKNTTSTYWLKSWSSSANVSLLSFIWLLVYQNSKHFSRAGASSLIFTDVTDQTVTLE